jgi:hypothetical protein
MASTLCQSVTHIYPYASIYPSAFQLSQPPISSGDSLFSSAARFDLSATDMPASMNDRHFQKTPAVGQLLSSTDAAEVSEEGEILNFDSDGLPPSRQTSAAVRQVIDLTRDGDDGSDSDSATSSPPCGRFWPRPLPLQSETRSCPLRRRRLISPMIMVTKAKATTAR